VHATSWSKSRATRSVQNRLNLIGTRAVGVILFGS
jgi:hypothetical protein